MYRDMGITTILVDLGGACLEIPLKDLMDLPDFKAHKDYHLVINPNIAEMSSMGGPEQDLAEIVTVLAISMDDTQPLPLMLPGLSLTANP